MALKKCKECGNEVSAKAPSCPKCGAPIKKKKKTGCLGYIGAAILIAIVLGVIGSLMQGGPNSNQNPPARRQLPQKVSEGAASDKLGSSPSPNPRYIIERVQVRLQPSNDAPATNTLDRQQKVDVYETQAGWARVSPFYDGAVEGVTGQVARWVPIASLSEVRPADLPRPAVEGDPRITGIPSVGEGGLTERDVMVLYAAASYFLETGKTQRIEYGDKSGSRPGVYYLNFGGASNHFFTPAEIPELDERIRSLGKKP